jgi:hypothetical protein
LKRIVISDEAKTDIRTIPQQIAMNILAAIHRLAESGAGNVKMLLEKRATSDSALVLPCALRPGRRRATQPRGQES